MADNPLDGLHVAKAPLLEMVFDIHQLLGKLVKLEVFLRLPVNLQPDLRQGLAELAVLREVALQKLLRQLETVARDQRYGFVIDAGCLKRRQ